MTQPHIGNYGVDSEVAESGRPWVEGFVARRFTREPSNHTSEEGLPGYLDRHAFPRSTASTRARWCAAARARRAPGGDHHGAQRGRRAGRRARRLPFDGGPRPGRGGHLSFAAHGSRRGAGRRALQAGGLRFRMQGEHPALAGSRGRRARGRARLHARARVLELGVDGVVLSNGPGDPEPLTGIVDSVRELLAAGMPLFGICLGHQLLGLALGGRTFKLKFGHHGGNQPVVDLATRRVAITSQNHGFAVDPDSLPAAAAPPRSTSTTAPSRRSRSRGARCSPSSNHPEAAPARTTRAAVPPLPGRAARPARRRLTPAWLTARSPVRSPGRSRAACWSIRAADCSARARAPRSAPRRWASPRSGSRWR